MSTTLGIEVCCNCGMTFAMPSDFQARMRRTRSDFYCPAGHKQHYLAEPEEDKLRRERDIAKQQLARAEEEAEQARRDAIAARKAVERVKKRANAGTCQCCNRTFANVAAHMRTQHPNVVPIKKVAPVREAKA